MPLALSTRRPRSASGTRPFFAFSCRSIFDVETILAIPLLESFLLLHALREWLMFASRGCPHQDCEVQVEIE